MTHLKTILCICAIATSSLLYPAGSEKIYRLNDKKKMLQRIDSRIKTARNKIEEITKDINTLQEMAPETLKQQYDRGVLIGTLKAKQKELENFIQEQQENKEKIDTEQITEPQPITKSLFSQQEAKSIVNTLVAKAKKDATQITKKEWEQGIAAFPDSQLNPTPGWKYALQQKWDLIKVLGLAEDNIREQQESIANILISLEMGSKKYESQKDKKEELIKQNQALIEDAEKIRKKIVELQLPESK